MRLNETEITAIKKAADKTFGPEATVKLFGSRVDDTAKGGDIDLLVTVPYVVDNPALSMAKMETAVIMALGDRKIDVVLNAPNLKKSEIHTIAETQGVLL
ncbi:nucleotidyltransferase domain-containing protein [Halomonas vilamensis]|uniref:Nucleotidyltransferase domain-containing protein n=1 Tax=Vreelandella vilamensis TaxID=531309 RepID=A0ABU1H2E2_9GAMM|nr:nucleotidyltransferase domain-containing protein [Halomonas vilamensis]MDR5898458.1 nucleotidyltransferase domain-containing protein [Halomonas vilamensis]